MPNRHLLIKLWQCQKAVPILPHEAKALLELFCFQPIVFSWRQNSSSSYFALWDKMKIPAFTLADQDWMGLMIFKNFADQDWIGFNFVGSGLDSDWKISQSAHLCRAAAPDGLVSAERTRLTRIDNFHSSLIFPAMGNLQFSLPQNLLIHFRNRFSSQLSE